MRGMNHRPSQTVASEASLDPTANSVRPPGMAKGSSRRFVMRAAAVDSPTAISGRVQLFPCRSWTPWRYPALLCRRWEALFNGLAARTGTDYCEIPAATRIDGGSSLDYLSSLEGHERWAMNLR
jgi:hypothetical protein